MKYKQPYSIKVPKRLNELEKEVIREYEHRKLKYEAKANRRYGNESSN